MEKFIDQIIKNLSANGFPEKKVSLPTEKMYEVADNKGLSLNKVLEELREKKMIDSEIGSEKIVFSMQKFENQQDMYAKAQEMMSQMSPEELQKMQDMIQNMSPEQREQMMEQAKKMGMI
ncbi:hypothetical protein [Halobacteriovorax sp. DA5]|uniref:hypothetical protein n=1 Tax=Halobacteriovorax sp. DA5 TaxID=2067553 RepID=UPI000CD13485|nr:hypothetical protein [Halobacteriovorax sp. DA5]POB14960.1 hypothetical protein C0Z22_00875 [Halobacteriovorax sp. DA5]